MTKSFFKIFYSKYNETQWLNEQGQQGFLLKKIKDNNYYFEHSKNKTYSYNIEHIEFPLQSESATNYFKSYEEKGIIPIIQSGTWIYFCATNKNIEPTYEVYKRNSSVYFWRSLYMLFFSVFGSILCGYHAFSGNFIVNAGHNGTGRIPTIEIKGDTLLDALKRCLNFLFDIFSDTYIKLYTSIFGQNDSSIILSFIVPITIILGVFFALNLYEYFLCQRLAKTCIKPKEHDHAK